MKKVFGKNSMFFVEKLIGQMVMFYYEGEADDEDLSREYQIQCLDSDDNEYILTVNGYGFGTSGPVLYTDSEDGEDFCDEIKLSPATETDGTEWNQNLNLLYKEIYDMKQTAREWYLESVESVDDILPLSDESLYWMAYETFQALGIDEIVLLTPYTLELENGDSVTFQKIICGGTLMDDLGGMYCNSLQLYVMDTEGNSHNITSLNFKENKTQEIVLKQISEEMGSVVKEYFNSSH